MGGCPGKESELGNEISYPTLRSRDGSGQEGMLDFQTRGLHGKEDSMSQKWNE